MTWKPDVTVAAVIERDGCFLMVEEETVLGPSFNQPAGHLESGEDLLAAVIRETREETAHVFVPEALIGVYQWTHPWSHTSYLRFAFCGTVTGHHPDEPLDQGIIAARWMTLDEIRATRGRHRSPMVVRNIEDYLSGRRLPLDAFQYLD